MLIIKAIYACNLPLIEDIIDAEKVISPAPIKHENNIFNCVLIPSDSGLLSNLQDLGEQQW